MRETPAVSLIAHLLLAFVAVDHFLYAGHTTREHKECETQFSRSIKVYRRVSRDVMHIPSRHLYFLRIGIITGFLVYSKPFGMKYEDTKINLFYDTCPMSSQTIEKPALLVKLC